MANARSKVGATTTAQLAWILAPLLPEPDGSIQEPSSRFEAAERGPNRVWCESIRGAASTITPLRQHPERDEEADMAETKTSTKRPTSAKTSGNVLSEEERAAMQETVRERRKAAKLSPEEARAQGEADVQAKIAQMPEDDRAIAARIHELVLANGPGLVPRTFYGMPAYAKDGKVICFFQAKSKFKVRYATFGFQPDASLDEAEMWPVAFALTSLTSASEKRIAELVKKAAG
jgi:uncharacterized protein YdhG (YjbR/CyaY superfamily)